MSYNNSLQTNDYYKNLNKHGNCTKCNFVSTQDNYKRGRTVCKFCYNNNVLRYYKKNFVLILVLNQMLVLKQIFQMN